MFYFCIKSCLVDNRTILMISAAFILKLAFQHDVCKSCSPCQTLEPKVNSQKLNSVVKKWVGYFGNFNMFIKDTGAWFYITE